MAKNLKLKAARAVRDMTQADLAAAVGVSRQTINAIEKGEYGLSLDWYGGYFKSDHQLDRCGNQRHHVWGCIPAISGSKVLPQE